METDVLREVMITEEATEHVVHPSIMSRDATKPLSSQTNNMDKKAANDITAKSSKRKITKPTGDKTQQIKRPKFLHDGFYGNGELEKLEMHQGYPKEQIVLSIMAKFNKQSQVLFYFNCFLFSS